MARTNEQTATTVASRAPKNKAQAPKAKDAEVKQAVAKETTRRTRQADVQTVAPPHVHKEASVIEERKVSKARVVKFRDATYRGATLPEGVFELAPDAEVKRWRDGSMRAQVNGVKWFEWEPSRGGLRICFSPRKFEILDSYTGKVGAVIGRPMPAEG
jgi:hypothetical protein